MFTPLYSCLDSRQLLVCSNVPKSKPHYPSVSALRPDVHRLLIGLNHSNAIRCLSSPQVLGGLVWILVAASDVPVPLLQGWVMFTSILTFSLSSTYLAMLITGLADRINTDWNVLVWKP